MSLYLFEVAVAGKPESEITEALVSVEGVLSARGASLVEAQVTADRGRLYLVVDAADESVAEAPLVAAGLAPTVRKQVRLIGQDLDTVRERRRSANFLVEWDLPAHLTMEAYLQRKAEKTPLYAQVPEVKFERTYVCEDLEKCLCFYDSPDEAAVRRAREAVGAPINRLAPIASLETEPASALDAGASSSARAEHV